MGSTVIWRLGQFEVECRKNNGLRLHGELSQPGDIAETSSSDIDTDGQHPTKVYLRAPKLLPAVLPRPVRPLPSDQQQ